MESKKPTQKDFMGMSTNQAIVLTILIFLICLMAGLFGSMLFKNSMQETPVQVVVAQPTYTLFPSETPTQIPTPRPTSTPIPEWNRFDFAEGKASIWLPQSYQGGDTVEFLDIVVLTMNTYIPDKLYVEWAENYIRENGVKFFAFDNTSMDIGIDIFVAQENIPSDLHITMDDYLNTIMDDFSSGGNRVIDRRIVQLDYYEAGRLMVDSEAQIDDTKANMRLAIYAIHLDDLMWVVMYRTGKGDFEIYSPVIELSVNTLYFQP